MASPLQPFARRSLIVALLGGAVLVLTGVLFASVAHADHGQGVDVSTERRAEVLAAVAENPQASRLLDKLRGRGALRTEVHPSPSGDNVAVDYFVGGELALELYLDGASLEIQRGVEHRLGRRGETQESWLARLINPWWTALLAALSVVALIAPRRLRSWHTLDVLVLAGMSVALPLSEVFLLSNTERADLRAASAVYTIGIAWFVARGAVWFFRRDEPRVATGAARQVPRAWVALLLTVSVLALGARGAANMESRTMFDISLASFIGGETLAAGEYLYGNERFIVMPGGDTYGPTAYVPYIPAALVHDWTDISWERTVAATTIGLDLLTALMLWLLVVHMAGTWPAALAVAWWAVHPLAVGSLLINANDQLVALLILGALLLSRHAMLRGAMVSAAAWVKFAPFAAAGALAFRRQGRREVLRYVAGGCVLAVPFVAWIVANDWEAFKYATVEFQGSRHEATSVWGAFGVDSLVWLGRAVAVVVLVAVAIRPRERSTRQLAAGAVVTLAAVQLTVSHIGLPYATWFMPPLAALLALERQSLQASRRGA